MPRAGLTPEVVVDAALAVIDDKGLDALTLAAVASRTGVAAPSLYKHVGGLTELRSRVAARVIDEVTQRLSAAIMGRSHDDAVRALMYTYRDYVVEHPGWYAAITPDALGDPALAAPAAVLLDVFRAVMRGYGLEGSAAIHAIRALRSIAHGFATIEVSGGFGLPEQLDESYDHLIQMFIDSLPGHR